MDDREEVLEFLVAGRFLRNIDELILVDFSG
jgi:hypothetical protein